MKQILNLANYNLNCINSNILKQRKLEKIILNQQNDNQVKLIQQNYSNKKFILKFE